MSPPSGAGVGVAMLIVSSLVSLYYNVIIAWAFYYLGSSFRSPLPWSCDAPNNRDHCQVGVLAWWHRGVCADVGLDRGVVSAGSCSRRAGGTLGTVAVTVTSWDRVLQNASASASWVSASELFWK